MADFIWIYSRVRHPQYGDGTVVERMEFNPKRLWVIWDHGGQFWIDTDEVIQIENKAAPSPTPQPPTLKELADAYKAAREAHSRYQYSNPDTGEEARLWAAREIARKAFNNGLYVVTGLTLPEIQEAFNG
jgi:hypothetical protein